jgi:transcriptional regulator of acetoin/glycerol metabolism
LHSLSGALADPDREVGMPAFALAPPSPVISLPESEKQAIARALAATNGERAKAARLLRIGRTTLYRKVKEYGL